jgi:hypothetical protein
MRRCQIGRARAFPDTPTAYDALEKRLCECSMLYDIMRHLGVNCELADGVVAQIYLCEESAIGVTKRALASAIVRGARLRKL